jgi:endoglucanase
MKIKLTLNCCRFVVPYRHPSNLKAQTTAKKTGMVLNSLEYLEYGSVNVMLAHDFYPEGHQGGVGIIQNGQRTATNGDLRLEPTPGQWSPIPEGGQAGGEQSYARDKRTHGIPQPRDKSQGL